MSTLAVRTLALLTLVLSFATSAASAHASPREQVAYSKTQVYSAALRYLRIELRYEITERDPDAAYLLFEYHPLGQKTSRFGAVEIVEQTRGVRLVVRLPDQPSYQETVMRDGLVRKLEQDYGVPALPREKPAPPAKTPSENKDGDKGSSRPNDRSPSEAAPSE